MSLCVICRRNTTASACQPCETRLVAILTRIPGWYDALENALIPGQRVADDVRVSTSKVYAPLPLDLHVLDLRSKGGIATMLIEWEADVRRRRLDGVPEALGSHERAAKASTAYLADALPWAMTQYDKMRDLSDALEWIENTCLSALGARQKLRHIGSCPEILDDHQACGRSLRVDPTEVSITCVCGTSWPRTHWVRLATAMQAGA
jgi:hypothetical protein